MPFLVKALNNIKVGRSMKESIHITMNIVRSYNFDVQNFHNTQIEDIDEDVPAQDSVEEVKDLALNLQQ